jgi:O-antigen ligase
VRATLAAVGEYVPSATVTGFLVLQGADATMSLAWAVLTLGSLAAALLGAIDLQHPLSRLERSMGYLLLVFTLSAALGVDLQRSLLLSVPVLASLLVWILVARSRDGSRGLLPIAMGLVTCAVIQSSLLVLTALRNLDGSPSDWVSDAGAAWLVVPNDIAWMACILPLIAVATRKLTRPVLLVLLAAFLALCILLRSRTGAAVAIMVALAYVALSSNPSPSRSGAGKMFVVAGLSLAVGCIAFGAGSMRARLQLWAAALSIWRDHPWLGVGLHNYVIAYRYYLPTAIVDPRITPWPHSLFLEIAAECGLMGIVAIIFFGVRLFQSYLAVERRGLSRLHCAAFSGLLGVGLLGIVEASLLREWVWVVGALLSALVSADRCENKNNAKTKALVEGTAIGGIRRAPLR